MDWIIRLHPGAGNINGIVPAPSLLEGLEADALLAHKAYAANSLLKKAASA